MAKNFNIFNGMAAQLDAADGPVSDRLTLYRKRKEELEQRLAETSSFISQIEALKFKPKQVAFHKTAGPVIIRDYLVKEFNSYQTTHPLVDNLPEDVEVGYIVVSHDSELAATDNDLVEYNESSRILYDK